MLVLSIKDREQACNVLFAGDAGPAELEKAVDVWRKLATERLRDRGFHVVKVPHHGSLASHWKALPHEKGSGEGQRVAGISAGTRTAIPDREVLREYLDNGWRVMATMRRVGGARVDRPMVARRPQPKTAGQS